MGNSTSTPDESRALSPTQR